MYYVIILNTFLKHFRIKLEIQMGFTLVGISEQIPEIIRF